MKLLLTILALFLATSLMSQKIYTWEEANLRAAKNNTLVFAVVGTGDKELASISKLLNNRRISDFMNRVAVPSFINTNDDIEHIVPRFLLEKPPFFAFFSPYGDLLESSSLNINADSVIPMYERSFELFKRRSSNVKNIKLFTSKDEAQKLGVNSIYCKLSFSPLDKEALLCRKDVFTMDSVADAFNGTVSVYTDISSSNVGMKYEYSNAKNEIIAQYSGYYNMSEMLNMLNDVVQKAKGVIFSYLPFDTISSRHKNTMLLIYNYARAEDKQMIRAVFNSTTLANYVQWSGRYACCAINGEIDGFDKAISTIGSELPIVCFLNENGDVVHKISGNHSSQFVLQEAQKAYEGKGLLYMNQQYESQKTNPQFLKSYIECLKNAGEKGKLDTVLENYFMLQAPNFISTSEDMAMFMQLFSNPNSQVFEYVLKNQNTLEEKNGVQLSSKIHSVWEEGAYAFVSDGKFDANGFDNYCKRMKKSGVRDWRAVSTKARMDAAEKTNDWKTFINIGEERWLNEKISDRELYLWGTLINERCKDKSIRFTAARWFAEAASRLEEAERRNGKADFASYKGFFYKLVNDLQD